MGAEGLFPKNSRGWLFLVGLALVYYFIYYICLYTPLYQTYTSGFYYYVLSKPEATSNDAKLFVRMPKYISALSEQSLIVTIRNTSNTPLEQTIVSVVPDSETAEFIRVSAVKGGLAVPFQAESNLVPGYVLFETIPPSTLVSGVFYVYVINDELDRDITLEFYVDGKPLKIDQTMKIDGTKAIQHSLIEVILLPPWSNGLLAVAVLIVIKLIEDNLETGKRVWALMLGWSLLLFGGIFIVSDIQFSDATRRGVSDESSIIDWIGLILIGLGLVIVNEDYRRLAIIQRATGWLKAGWQRVARQWKARWQKSESVEPQPSNLAVNGTPIGSNQANPMPNQQLPFNAESPPTQPEDSK